MKNAYKIRFILASFITALIFLIILGMAFQADFLEGFFEFLIENWAVILGGILASALILTLFFGRIFCSTICPCGYLMELFNILKSKKSKFNGGYPFSYVAVIIFLGAFLGGYSAVLKLNAPENIELKAAWFILGIILVGIFCALTYKNRIFCKKICPLGIIFGFISKISLFKTQTTKHFSNSKKLEKTCQMGAIEQNKINNKNCIKCFKCLNNSEIHFSIPKKTTNFSFKKRKIKFNIVFWAFYSFLAKQFRSLKEKITKNNGKIILPPGANTKAEFINKCYNCNLCVANCPNKIIVEATDTVKIPHIDPNKGFCSKNCNKCMEVCPINALNRVPLKEKQKIKIALAKINYDKCKNCRTCVDECPYKAIEGEKPKIDKEKCKGCMKCKIKCPNDAIEVITLKRQIID